LTLNVRKPLRTREGRPVTFLGFNHARNTIIVEVDYGVGHTRAPEYRNADGTVINEATRFGARLTATRIESPDDVLNIPQDTVRFYNVYADGTTGRTPHGTFDNAVARVKVGKVRIGILEVLAENDVPVASRYRNCTPAKRITSAEKGTFTEQFGFNSNRFTLALNNG
jgi:hypothetical protein